MIAEFTCWSIPTNTRTLLHVVNAPSIEASNRNHEEAWRRDLEYLGEQLHRRGLDVEAIIEGVASFEIAIPSWALGAGGTRFGRFPIVGEPRNLLEKMEDVAVVHRLTAATPRVSLHVPWDEPEDPSVLREQAAGLGLGFDAVNSNTFQDQAGQRHSYKFGAFGHADPRVREQAIEHNLHVVEVGRALGSDAITIWLVDGGNYPGQTHFRRTYDRVLDGLRQVYAQLPESWSMLIEHKPYEPAFYSMVVADWGSSLMLARSIGQQALCLVDLGHHLPNANVEQIVARLITAGKLGGFHFNDSKYGDDDLTAGSIRPYQLFLVLNELVDAAMDGSLAAMSVARVAPKLGVGHAVSQDAPGVPRDSAVRAFPPCMIDQSHNVKDPIEALLQTVDRLQRACARALLVRRDALAHCQDVQDVLMAEETLREAYETDVSSLVAAARLRGGGAIDPVGAFRESGYRDRVAATRCFRGLHASPEFVNRFHEVPVSSQEASATGCTG